ncbi:protein kinase [Streptomyces sp. NPDC127098]|uniref:protein kinase domain-containing protein n=1 Tax=Streptomyces sp. NPDC127098 TaxID=3347137 RepID=UPI00365A7598
MKLGYPAGPSHGYTAFAPAREVAVLERLGRDGLYTGRWERGTWGVQPWCEGTSLWELWEPYRTVGGEPDVRTALACARALAELHEAGWVHGDVQPAHFIVSAEGRVRLIDLALARGGEVPEWCDFAFRGCLVHYESPEISRSVLATGEAVPTPASDVFAFGASLFMSLTGRRVVDFPGDADRETQRRFIARWRRPRGEVPGALGRLVEAMVSPSPADRPGMAEVCAGFGRAQASGGRMPTGS